MLSIKRPGITVELVATFVVVPFCRFAGLTAPVAAVYISRRNITVRVQSATVNRRPARVFRDGSVQKGRGKGHEPHRRSAAGLRAHGFRPEAADRSGGRGGDGASVGRAVGPGEARVRQDFGRQEVPGQERRLR